MKRKIVVKCSVKEFNELLKEVWNSGRKSFICLREPKEDEWISLRVFIWTTVSYIHMVANIDGRVKRYDCNLAVENSDDKGSNKTGADAYATLQKYYKAPDFDYQPFSYGIKPYRNKKYVGKRVPNCIGYDMNSAFSYGMLQPLPDTSRPLGPGVVESNMYAFDIDGTRMRSGYSMHRFYLMDSPYKKFVETWYKRKKNPKNNQQKLDAKMVLNASIGALQHHNCFLRAAILNNFNEYMQYIIRKYKNFIVSSNIDSIVAIQRIPELDHRLSEEIGQFKIEHTGDFAIAKNGMSTQWNYEIPAYGAGKPKLWFKNFEKINGRPFDILLDEPPVIGNGYKFDVSTCQLVEVNYSEKEI